MLQDTENNMLINKLQSEVDMLKKCIDLVPSSDNDNNQVQHMLQIIKQCYMYKGYLKSKSHYWKINKIWLKVYFEKYISIINSLSTLR